MPSQHKRKAKSAVTLHNFFSSSSGPSKSGRNVSSSHFRSSIPIHDVITIDDSDIEPEVVKRTPTKKPRPSNHSEEVQLVKQNTSFNNIEHETNSPCSKQGAAKGERIYSFGAPVLLAKPHSMQPVNEAARPTITLPLISPVGIPPPEENLREECRIDRGLRADIADEWGLRDDELTFTHVHDEDENIIEHMLTDGAYFPSEMDEITVCPSCGILLSTVSLPESTRHVNECLGTGGPSDKASDTTVCKPFTPLVSSMEVHRPDDDFKTTPAQGNGNAFSILMSSHKENEAWKEASSVEEPTKNRGRRKAPFYKVLQGMPIAVDAFRYGTIPNVNAYFLTHAHSDHYTNLTSNWKSGPIYCSECTANLIIHMLSVDKKWVHSLPFDTPTVIPDTGGVIVTLIEANHCPGSCLFFFEGRQTANAGDTMFKSPSVGSSKIFRYLHCGDFRASPRHTLHPAIKGKRIDHVYLDTTYLDPKYTFPPQPLVISACSDLVRKITSGEATEENSKLIDSKLTNTWRPHPGSEGRRPGNEALLVVVGTYSIGKERIVKAIAHTLQTKVYCDDRKAAILRCQADPELDTLITSDPLKAAVHILPLGMITSDKLKVYLERFRSMFCRIVAFKPTGWTYIPPAGADQMPSVSSIISRPHRNYTYANLRPARNSTPSLQVFLVPYSEHSSFFELTCFALSIDWGKIITTVNVGSETSRGKMAKWISKWETERKKRKPSVVPHRSIDYW